MAQVQGWWDCDLPWQCNDLLGQECLILLVEELEPPVQMSKDANEYTTCAKTKCTCMRMFTVCSYTMMLPVRVSKRAPKLMSNLWVQNSHTLQYNQRQTYNRVRKNWKVGQHTRGLELKYIHIHSHRCTSHSHRNAAFGTSLDLVAAMHIQYIRCCLLYCAALGYFLLFHQGHRLKARNQTHFLDQESTIGEMIFLIFGIAILLDLHVWRIKNPFLAIVNMTVGLWQL